MYLKCIISVSLLCALHLCVYDIVYVMQQIRNEDLNNFLFFWTILSSTSSPLRLLVCLPRMSGSALANLNLL